jgi:murein tripeptide amidase MpaA
MYRTIAQLDEAIDALVRTRPDICTREFLHSSVEGRPIQALRLRAGGGEDRRGVLIVGGMHARELMNPDAIVELAFDLVLAYTSGGGLTYGGAEWSSLDVRVMLETLDIWMLPCANPDGRQYVMTTAWDWRKNRRDNPGTTWEGVDLNRNCDFMWSVIGANTSCNAWSDSFVGSAPFSEPEADNIRLLWDTHRIDVFADVHSYSELVLLPWGHAPTQTTAPLPNFTTLPVEACGPLEPPGHREFMPPTDQLRYQTAATRVAEAIRAVRGRNYVWIPTYELYNSPSTSGTTTGTTTDYLYSRHISDPGRRKTFAFGLETGPNSGDDRESFQPADPEPVKNDTKAGLVALIQLSICGIEFIGETVQLGTVESVRGARDELLVSSEKGRGWVELVTSIEAELLGIVLADKRLTGQAIRLIARVQKLAAKREKAIVSARDVEDGLEFLESLKSRAARPEVRAAISIASQQLKRAAGQTVAANLNRLARSTPPKL